VGVIAQKLVKGLERHGGTIRYKARVTKVLLNKGQAVGVRLADGEEIRSRRVVSNATRWDTFGGLIDAEDTPPPRSPGGGATSRLPRFCRCTWALKRP
jgi:prolycopene isomerase